MKKSIRSYWFLLYCLYLSNVSFALTAFEGTVISPPSPMFNVIVEQFVEDSWKMMQSIKSTENGQFSALINFDHTGQYRIRMSTDPKKWGDFIVNVDQLPTNGFHFTLNYSDLKGLPISIENSPEQNAYAELMTPFNQLLINADSLDKNGIDFLRREKELAEKCEAIRIKFKGTFTADVLTQVVASPISPMWSEPQPIVDSLLAFRSNHGIDRIPFGNALVINHSALIRRLNVYYTPFEESHHPEVYIDKVMVKGLVNDEVSAFLFRFLLDKMIDYRNEEGLSYLITWYAQDCTENDHVQEATRNLLLALDKCKPGNTIEFLTLPDLNGKMISSKEIISKNKITLLMFWKGTCSHCREFEPVLEEIYSRYHAKGFEVFAIGTDKLESEWRPQAIQNNSPWPSVFLPMDQRRDFSKRFPVPSTPTLMAVDKDGKIIRRLIMRSKLEPTLIEMFDQLAKK